MSSGQDFTFGGNGRNAYSGVLSGNGTLYKTGTGTQTFSGAAGSYSGLFDINAGTVRTAMTALQNASVRNLVAGGLNGIDTTLGALAGSAVSTSAAAPDGRRQPQQPLLQRQHQRLR